MEDRVDMNADEAPAGQPRDAEQRSAEEADLRDSLDRLSRLAAVNLELESLLTRVASYAVQAIPGADGAGLTLLEQDRRTRSWRPRVRQRDRRIQYGLGEGPCIRAAADGQPMLSGSLGGDPRWPRFGGRVARIGVHSVLSLPLVSGQGGRGDERLRPCQGRVRRAGRRSGDNVRRPGRDRRAERAYPGPNPAAGGEPAGRVGDPGGHRSGRGDHDQPQRRHRDRGDGAAPG